MYMNKNRLIFNEQNARKSLRVNDVRFYNSSPKYIP